LVLVEYADFFHVKQTTVNLSYSTYPIEFFWPSLGKD